MLVRATYGRGFQLCGSGQRNASPATTGMYPIQTPDHGLKDRIRRLFLRTIKSIKSRCCVKCVMAEMGVVARVLVHGHGHGDKGLSATGILTNTCN